MIRSWLDEVYPKIAEAERIAMSERLDMSLIERKKVESMKTFFEINNVIRVSFIEMQYMKRVSYSFVARIWRLTVYAKSNTLPRQHIALGNDECYCCHGRCHVGK